MPLDRKVAERLRYVQVPVICVANKTDHAGLESQADEFYQFGRKVVRTSTQGGPRQGRTDGGRAGKAAARRRDAGRPKRA